MSIKSFDTINGPRRLFPLIRSRQLQIRPLNIPISINLAEGRLTLLWGMIVYIIPYSVLRLGRAINTIFNRSLVYPKSAEVPS